MALAAMLPAPLPAAAFVAPAARASTAAPAPARPAQAPRYTGAGPRPLALLAAAGVAGCRRVGRVRRRCLGKLKALPGLGVAAKEKLGAGELVVAERPLLQLEGPPGPDDVDRLLRLPVEQRQAIMAICQGREEKGVDSPLQVLARSRVPRSPRAYESVICPTIGRFRHSCNPNCEQSFHEETGEERVFTSTFVSAGEELTLPFTDILLPVAQRAKAIKENFPTERNSAKRLKQDPEGDYRRLNMIKLEAKVEEALEYGYETEDFRRGLEIVLDLLELYDREGFFSRSLREKACYQAFQFELKAGRQKEAMKWINKAYQNARLARGDDHEETKLLKQYMEKPETHPASPMIKPGDEMPIALGVSLAAMAFLTISTFQMLMPKDPFAI